VAKRRFRTPAETAPEQLDPAERRARRRRDRELVKRGKKVPLGRSSPWRRAALLGIPAVVIVAIVLVLLYGNLFAAPCVQFQTIPSSSGQPEFPPHNTTNFDGTWCPANVALVEHIHPYLQIKVEGQTVGIPPTQSATPQNPDWPSIGRNSTYPGGYACDLPLHTHPPEPAGGLPDGIIHVESAWPYLYNLSDFFHVWSQSFSSVFVNSSSPSQPVIYQTNNLLGFTADSTHRIDLFVDGQPSAAGPGLVLNTLDYAENPYPSCLAQKYGTGHVILLTYTTVGAAALGSGLHPGGLATAGADPMVYWTSLGGPLQKVGSAVAQATDGDHLTFAGLHWLAGRPVGG